MKTQASAPWASALPTKPYLQPYSSLQSTFSVTTTTQCLSPGWTVGKWVGDTAGCRAVDWLVVQMVGG